MLLSTKKELIGCSDIPTKISPLMCFQIRRGRPTFDLDVAPYKNQLNFNQNQRPSLPNPQEPCPTAPFYTRRGTDTDIATVGSEPLNPMEISFVSRPPKLPKAVSSGGFAGGLGHFVHVEVMKKRKVSGYTVVRAESNGGGGEAVERREAKSSSTAGYNQVPAMEVTTLNQSFNDTEFPVWEKIGAIVRLGYGIGIYGAMAVAGRVICSLSGIDCMGGFDLSLNAIVQGLGYAAPPIMALLFILDDEVVKLSPHARAIRDVEDEELRSFFYGMSAWQFMLIVAASSVGEELFYRAAVQGALAEIFLRGSNLFTDTRGMALLVGVLPPFVPFAQAYAAVITAALIGSLYYLAASPKDPTYVVAPVLKSKSGREDLKKLFAAWYERRQMKKIYSPLLEAFLALYLGFEWIQTDNILAPIITHGIYSCVILGHGLWKINDHQRRLRQRVQKLKLEGKISRK